MTPSVTIVVPARNERDDIGDCLAAIAAQDYPLADLEVIVVDGDSVDGTDEVAEKLLAEASFGASQVIRNPGGTTPSNLNCGLAEATGELFVRVDARSIIPPHYVRTVTSLLRERSELAVVGGSQRAVARGISPKAVGIARALNNRWSTGFARYRRSDASGPGDTVYLGAFRTDQLRAAGGWDVRFPTNQDFDLNRRMTDQGLVWFVGGLPVGYRPRVSLRELWRQYVRFGRWKATYWSTTGDAPQLRQRIIVAGPVATCGLILAACALERSPKPFVSSVALGAGGLLFVERMGAREPSADALGHLMGAAAIAATSGGWLVGVYSSLFKSAVRGTRSRR